MMDRQTAETTIERPGSLSLVRLFALLMGVLILVQAFLAGRGFFLSDTNLLKTHRYLGMVTVVVALIQVGVVLATLQSGRERSMLLGMSGLILVLTVIQLMLGFSAKDGSGEAAAWHIFNGVLLTGVIAAYTNTTVRLRSARM